MHAKSLQLCLTLCDAMNCSLPGSSVHGILQTQMVEWVVIPFPGYLPDPGIKLASLMSPALAVGFFTTSTTWEVHLLSSSFHYCVYSMCDFNIYVKC